MKTKNEEEIAENFAKTFEDQANSIGSNCICEPRTFEYIKDIKQKITEIKEITEKEIKTLIKDMDVRKEPEIDKIRLQDIKNDTNN